MVLKTLADIFHHQHIFPLIFIVVHQPVAQTLGLLYRQNGWRRCLLAFQCAASAASLQALGRRAEEGIAGVKDHVQKMMIRRV